MCADIVTVILNAHQEPHRVKFCNNLFARLIAIQTLKFSAICVDRRIIIHDIDLRQMMTFTDFKIVRVMSGRNLYHTRPKIFLHIGISNNRDLTVNKRNLHHLSHQMRIAFILRVNRDRRIAKHGFRAGCRKFKKFFRPNHRIFNMPEMSILLLVLHLRVRDGSLAYRTPVDNAGTLVDKPLIMHFAEYFLNCLRAALIHGKTFSVPITGGTHFFKLLDNASAILRSPLPGAL